MFELHSYMFRTVNWLIFRESHNFANHTHTQQCDHWIWLLCPIFKGQEEFLILEDRMDMLPETSVRNYYLTRRSIPEERKS
jgi:hypothetical protein